VADTSVIYCRRTRLESIWRIHPCSTLALWRYWRQNGAMPSVQIKDVPEETHRVLRERAARAHQSLQEYLLSRLIADAKQPTLDEVLDRVATRRGARVTFTSAVDHVRAERDRR
jgi:antitoxin FitA